MFNFCKINKPDMECVNGMGTLVITFLYLHDQKSSLTEELAPDYQYAAVTLHATV